MLNIPTEPIGSISRPAHLVEAVAAKSDDPIDPRIETPEEVCERVLEAAESIPLAQLGRVEGTALASERLKGA